MGKGKLVHETNVLNYVSDALSYLISWPLKCAHGKDPG